MTRAIDMALPAPVHPEARAPAPPAVLLGLGCAVPGAARPQEEMAEMAAQQWGLRGSALARWRRIIQASGVRTRHVATDEARIMPLSTAQRMDLYRTLAPPLATSAGAAALAQSGVEPGAVTDLVVVSCTGFAAPGVDVDLVERLGLSPTVRRSCIGFMGCFGAITGLRSAVGTCSADPGAIVLVVCVELCSLHLRSQHDPQSMVAAALFADGAAAAVVGRRQSSPGGSSEGPAALAEIGLGASRLLTEGRDWMSWLVTDTGFAMTLSKRVPEALRSSLGAFVMEAAGARPRTVIVHPGGPGILDAVDDALALEAGSGLELSRSVLSRFGNMSSATVLFVLDEARRRGCPAPALLIAFGPGLTIEGLPVRAAAELPGFP